MATGLVLAAGSSKRLGQPKHAHAAVHVPMAGPIPPDVDTWDDYEALLA